MGLDLYVALKAPYAGDPTDDDVVFRMLDLVVGDLALVGVRVGQTISRVARVSCLTAATRSNARMDWATRPCRPMTLPLSSGATSRRRMMWPDWSSSVTLTSSGSETIDRAIYSTSSLIRP